MAAETEYMPRKIVCCVLAVTALAFLGIFTMNHDMILGGWLIFNQGTYM